MRQIGFFILFFATVVPAAAKDLAVITHRGNSIQTIPIAYLVKVCKGATSKWPDGTNVVVVLPDPALPGMALALQKVFGMNVADARATLQKSSGVRVVGDDQAAVQTVEITPGAIALVDVYAISGKVNVVRIDGKLPLEPGYALHSNQ